MTLIYPLPSDTRQKFAIRNERCSNLSLLLDRYIGYPQPWEFDEEQKSKLFQAVANEFKFSANLIQAYHQRWLHMTRTLPDVQHFQASPEWRLVVGLGQTSILETSMTLDRVTGIPIIPGSALKGVAAAYALLNQLGETNRFEQVEKVYQQYQKQKLAELPDGYQDFIKVFGVQSEAGKVIFLDAVPTKVPKLEVDIMNNHYPEYYGTGNQPPTPYQNPNPVYFLTLGRESEFAFAVASRNQHSGTEQLVSLAAEWLREGLSTLGVGAKTAAGYGYLL
jgi:CRISPR-associated protein Cmr6